MYYNYLRIIELWTHSKGSLFPADKQVAIGCWKGRANISVMVSALDCQELLERMPMYMEEDTAMSLHKNKPSFVETADKIGDNTEAKANSEVLEQTAT